ncbi:MAG TPA: hypothetical protein DCK98_10645 [Chloroflexi bacterium]|nr:hypothetical protein [Chloroflexota bacterium]HAL26283.1 hypothetical protein [Chloroflexota bacterium]
MTYTPSESTAFHRHGQRVPNSMDGVPSITQPPIKPGLTYAYEFTAGPFGSTTHTTTRRSRSAWECLDR